MGAEQLDNPLQNPDSPRLFSQDQIEVANSPQARKRAHQNTARRLHNASQRSRLRTSIKNFVKSLQSKDVSAAREAYRQATSSIDGAVHKGLHHRNRAARLKSRLNNRLRQMETS